MRQKQLGRCSSDWTASQQKSWGDYWSTSVQIKTHTGTHSFIFSIYHGSSGICRKRFELTSNHISPTGHGRGETAHVWGVQTNKRLSERSSHRATVNCQPWFRAEALLLPADKVALVRSAEPLHLCTRLDGEKEGLWLQRHPSGQGSVAALHHRSTTNWTSSTFLLSGHQLHLMFTSVKTACSVVCRESCM